MFVAGNGPASSEKARTLLGWVPRELDLISDISQPKYYTWSKGSSKHVAEAETCRMMRDDRRRLD